MEPTQQSHQPSEDTNVGNGGGSKGSFLCRQSSSRWTPTTDQIRILKDLYYNNGIRSPNADQIQRISARLRQYGKIEGKNVFYWFQNHKARERQKKRYTPDHQLISPAINASTNLQQQQPVMRRSNNNLSSIIDSSTAPTWKPDGLDHPHDTKFPISCIATSVAGFPAETSSPAGLVGVGQIGSYGYGPKTMEKSFRECSISSQASSTIMGSRSQNYGWIASNTNYDPFIPSYGFYEYQPPRGSVELLKHHHEDDSEDEEYEEEEFGCQVETLPLFPMHDEDHFNGGYFSNNFKTPSSNNNTNHSSYYFGNHGGGSCTSLELSLNSLVGHSHDAL